MRQIFKYKSRTARMYKKNATFSMQGTYVSAENDTMQSIYAMEGKQSSLISTR